MTIFEQIKELASNLTPEEKELLSQFLTESPNEDATSRKPQSLRGIWQAKFPSDPDIDRELREIRHEWEKEWPEGFTR